VISHLFANDAPDKMDDTNRLWEELIDKKYKTLISPLVTEEIEKCSEPKRNQMFEKLAQIEFQMLNRTNETNQLAKEYLIKGVLNEKNRDDCLHIAFAVVNTCDFIVSWNFKHLVNVKTINKIKIVNAINHYREIGIISPTMLIEGAD